MTLPDTSTSKEPSKEQLIKLIRKLDKTLERWHKSGAPHGRYSIHNLRQEYAELLGIDNDVKNYQ